MDLRSLVELDLREALAPVNRGNGGLGQFVPAMRTAAQLRERAAAEVLDLKLSRACFIGGALVGTCLVERLDAQIHLDALGVEPLAQQRGASSSLVEAVCSAAAAVGVKRASVYVSDFDSALLSSLQALGFSRRRGVARYILGSAPAPLAQPQDLGAGPASASEGSREPTARSVPLAEALPLLYGAVDPGLLLFGQQAGVLSRLSGKLTAYVVTTPTSAGKPVAAAVFERDRKLLQALGGDPAQLPGLLCLLAARHGVACMDAIVEGHPAQAALIAAGFQRVSLRAELVKDLG
jgi:GNAT superfamily N-acetyltransferase